MHACIRSTSASPLINHLLTTNYMLDIIKRLAVALLVLIVGLMLNCIIGAGIAYLLGIPVEVGVVGLCVLSLALPPLIKGHAARAGVNQEVWTGVMIRLLREAAENLGWYKFIRSYDEYVNNDTIHFVELGGDPKVLVNNTTYPLNVATIADADKPISLDNFETEATAISDKELDTINYDKLGSVQDRHKETVAAKIHAKAIHALAPQSHSADSPVMLTTGATSDEGGRKKLSLADLRILKTLADNWKLPAGERVLVLCPDHVQDLLSVSEAFERQYNMDNKEGRIGRLYGFEIFEYTDTPYYTVASKTKLAFGAVPGSGARSASVMFHSGSCMRAMGSLITYHSEAKNDPIHHRSLFNVRQRAICAPLRSKQCLAAIVSANA